jgi:copper chaperone CopZ
VLAIQSNTYPRRELAVDKKVFDVPKMYADHHVDAVRNALVKLDGVDNVVASSSFKRVAVSYDPKRLSADAIADALRQAGYGPGEEWELPRIPEGKEDSSSWFQTLQRVTVTDQRDLEASGDHRRY